VSLIETGKRRPSLRSWERIRQTLGMSEPLPEKAWRQQPRQISDELVATLGACLAAVRQAALAELAQAAGAAISDVRLGLRRLADPSSLATAESGCAASLEDGRTAVHNRTAWKARSQGERILNGGTGRLTHTLLCARAEPC
jgi:hypothetical protein